MGAVLRRPDRLNAVHPNHVILRPPFAVSPFIRFCRWSFLFAGIVYGHYRYNYLCVKHAGVREYEQKKKIAAEKLHNQHARWANYDSLHSVSLQLGLGWDDKMIKQFGVDGAFDLHPEDKMDM